MDEIILRDHFMKAVGILVDEKGRIKDRLLIAYASQLSVIDPKRDIPESLLADFELLRYSLSDADMPYGYGERAAKKIAEMNEEDASSLARIVFSMFLRVCNLETATASS
jgi:hypothetical protein